MDASANPSAAAVATEPLKTYLELANEISSATVDPIIAILEKALPGEAFELHLRHNAGGDVDRMQALIDTLNETHATVEITFSRYVMSAAATIWLYFLVGSTLNVQSLPPRKRGVVIYHRPRKSLGDYQCFTNEIDDQNPLKALLEKKLKIFDDLFEKVHTALLRIGPDGQVRCVPSEFMSNQGDNLQYRHWLYRLRESYYRNQDCLIPV